MFNKLGLSPLLLSTCQKIQYITPTPIQKLAIPSILKGESVIVNSQTGSGKTAVFGLPLIQKLSKQPFSICALIIAPSRQLAYQISHQISIFAQGINLRLSLLIGGASISKQIQSLQQYPHIVIGTPGRMLDMLSSSLKFQQDIKNVQMLILDQADRLFEDSLIQQMKSLVKNATNLNQIILATATIDQNFQAKKLQSILSTKINFIKHSTYQGIKTVSSACLTQNFILTPQQLKPGYLLAILQKHSIQKIIIFVKTCKQCTLMSQTLKFLKYPSTALHSFLKLNQRIANLAMFRTDQVRILVTTDLTSRGLDIPNVNLIINYNLPRKISDYIHRVGRTARNGLQGQAISFVTQYQQNLFLQIQQYIGIKISQYKINLQLQLLSSFNKAKRQVKIQLLSSGILNYIHQQSQLKKIHKTYLNNHKQYSSLSSLDYHLQ